MKHQHNTNEHTSSTRVVVTTSWDDGHVDDVRLAELLKKYGIAGTFYISPENVELSPEERLNIEQLQHLATSFEIGAHTLTHRHLPTLSDEDAVRDIVGSKDSLEQIAGRPVESFCYPAGKYEPRHVLMAQNAGFRIARTVQRFIFNVEHPFECGTSIHTYDHWSDTWSLLRYARFNPILFLKLYHHWDRQAIHMFDRVQKTGGVFHLWGHSWELAQRDGWKRLENVLAYIAHKEGVVYVTNGELV
jgi:peptidoglycan/xylan/chitin deacetylase (PgdA/CDA1 family)